MRITFTRNTEPGWDRTLTLSGGRGRLEVALDMASPKGERIALSHELKRADVVRIREELGAWLESPSSFPECHEPGCGAPCLEGSDFCGDHQG